MTVENQFPYQSFTANGLQTNFALGFYVDDKDHFEVSKNDQAVSKNDYSYDKGSNSIIFNTSPNQGDVVEVKRSTTADRATTYATYNNTFRPEVLNKDIDRLWLKIQELGVADLLLKIYTDKLHAEQKAYVDEQDQIIKTIINDLRSYLDDKDNTLQNNINNLRIHVDTKDNDLKTYFNNLITQQGTSLNQLTDYYQHLLKNIANIAAEKGWLASLVVDASGKNQQELNDYFRASTKIITPDQFGDVTGDATYAVLRACEYANQLKANGKGRVEIQFKGDYKIRQTIVLKGGVSINLDGGRIIADTDFVGDKLIYINNGENYAEKFAIYGMGELLCNSKVDIGVALDKCRFANLNSFSVSGADLYGVVAGLQDGISSCYEINCHQVKVTYASKPNNPNSIGIFYGNCTDSYITDTNVQGYRKGYKVSGGSVYLTGAHCWGAASQMAMTHGFEINGSNAILTNCYADTPYDLYGDLGDLYGIYLHGWNPSVIGGSCFMNTDFVGTAKIATHDRVYPLYCSREIYGSIRDFHIHGAKSDTRYKAPIGGEYSSMQVDSLIDEGSQEFVDYSSIKNQNRREVLNTALFTQTRPFLMSNVPGASKLIEFCTDGKDRWASGIIGGSETGNNGGADYVLTRYDDNGNILGNTMRARRSDSQIEFLDGPVRFVGSYDKPIRFGDSYRMWVDTYGMLRLNYGTPTADSHGYAISKRVSVPSSATSSGVVGQWASDPAYLYIYTGNNTTHTWARTALSSW